MALFEFGLPGNNNNNNNNNRMTRYFDTLSINVAFSPRFPSSHYPCLLGFQSTFVFSESHPSYFRSHESFFHLIIPVFPGFQSTFVFSESHPSFLSSFLLTNVLALMSLLALKSIIPSALISFSLSSGNRESNIEFVVVCTQSSQV